ncbi:MAG: hypothetical protein WC069_00760 [Candidatus Shapirobacteria bacterium]
MALTTTTQTEIHRCGAGRQVAVETTTNDGLRRATIRNNFLMNFFHETELINQINWCCRCAGKNGFARGCDASSQTKNQLNSVE